jgi:hypothetical protein
VHFVGYTEKEYISAIVVSEILIDFRWLCYSVNEFVFSVGLSYIDLVLYILDQIFFENVVISSSVVGGGSFFFLSRRTKYQFSFSE